MTMHKYAAGQAAKRSLDHARSHPRTAILIVLDCHLIRAPRSEAPGRADLFGTEQRKVQEFLMTVRRVADPVDDFTVRAAIQ